MIGAFGLILPRLQVLGHQMALKFLAQPVTYLLIPVIAAWVGWFTNWLAVQMIFYPIEFCGLPLYRREETPLGFLGWQGIIPCKTRRMTESMVEMVQTELLSVEEAFSRMDPERVATLMSPELPIMIRNIFQEIPSLAWLVTATTTTTTTTTTNATTTTTNTTATPAVASLWVGSLLQALSRWSEPSIRYYSDKFLIQLTKAMQGEHERVFNLRNCVVNQMLLNRAKLGELFRQCGQKELDFLVNSGIWFGFLLGLIQMAVALVWDNPWSLSM
jgi:uncharacterized membrane protein YheB (UPF0754 family)